jgi:hypothetical protein
MNTRKLVRYLGVESHGTLYMMRTDDFRLTDDRFSPHHEVIGEGTFKGRTGHDGSGRSTGTLTLTDGSEYTVWSDWSAKPS